jgi:hypothetical protein
VETVVDSPETVGQGRVKIGNQTHDLGQPAGRNAFVALLRLPPDQAQKVAAVIDEAQDKAKDEVAGIARVWARAEQGQSVPSRIIMSGHHGGYGVYGDDNGTIPWELLLKLAQALPRGASQVEDLHVAACYSGGAHLEGTYARIFPSLRTIWAYTGSAPGSGSGATVHQAAWDQATRGRGTRVAETAERLKQQGVRKAENIAARSMDEATRTSMAEIEAARELVQRDRNTVFHDYFSGRREVESSQTGPLRDFYNNVQRVLQSPNLDEWDRRSMQRLADQTIRTLFYNSNIRGKFQQEYGAQIAAGYRALGLTPPNFAGLSRAQAREQASIFERAAYNAQERSPEVAAAERLLRGLDDLDAEIIKREWV